jgi:signal transducing adaptor molecule
MFRGGQPNPYEDVVGEIKVNITNLVHGLTHYPAKTTDENLTSENWELILNLCDKVQDDGEQG